MASIRDLILQIVEKKEGNALISAARDIEQLGRGMDATGDSTKAFTKDAKALNAEIEKSTARIKDLHKQFAATGDTSLFGDIRKEETRLRNLTKTVKALTPEFVQAGENVGQALGTSVSNSFFKQVTGAFSGEGGAGIPALIAAVVGALAVALPVIGALLSGAVAGAVGTAGLAAGIIAAAHDPTVKDALTAFVDDAKKQFFSIGANFVGPVKQGLAILDQELANSHLDKVFAGAAMDVQTIADGIARLVRNVLPGLQRALDRSAPFAVVAADGLAQFGDALGYSFDQISKSKGALEGLKSLFLLVNGTIIGLTNTLTWLGNAYDWLGQKASDLFLALAKGADFFGAHGQAKDFRDMATTLHNLGNSTVGATIATKDLGAATTKTAEALQRQNEELQNTLDLINHVFDTVANLDEAQLRLAEGWKALSDSIAENGKHWNDNTDAAFKNRQEVLNQIRELDRVRDAEIKNGVAVKDANAEYEAGLQKVLNFAGALGATKEQLDKIKGTYDIVLVITTIGDVVSGVTKKLASLIPHFDSGGVVDGPVGAPQLAVVHGGERVLTPSQQTSAGGGGQPIQIVMSIDPSGASDSMGAAMLKFLRDHVRFNGGSADVAFS